MTHRSSGVLAKSLAAWSLVLVGAVGVAGPALAGNPQPAKPQAPCTTTLGSTFGSATCTNKPLAAPRHRAVVSCGTTENKAVVLRYGEWTYDKYSLSECEPGELATEVSFELGPASW